MHFTFRRCTPRSSSSLWLRSLFFAKCHRSRPGCRCSNHGRLLSPDHTVCHHQNIGALPSVFQRIFEEAFGLRQVAAGGFGAVLMNGIKRGLLFSNGAGSGSAPCAAAAADVSHPAKAGPDHEGIRCLYRYHPDLYLFCTVDAAGSVR